MPTHEQFQAKTAFNLTATIAAGQTASEELDLNGCALCGLFLPATFDGTTVTLTAAPAPGGTHVAVQDGAGNAYTLTGAASRYVPVSNLAITSGLRFIKLVAGTSQSTTDTVITLALRPV